MKKICFIVIISLLITFCMPVNALAADNLSLTNKLTAADGTAGDYFGYSVALSGDIAVVGSYTKDSYKGAVYAYNLYTGAVSKLVASDGEASDLFGYSVAIDGNTVVVGAPGDGDNGSQSGAVYIYDMSNGNAQTKITAADGGAGDFFGGAVAVSGDVVVVGAHAEESNKGAAYVYDLSANTQTKITANDGEAHDYFGVSVDVSASHVLVGAHYDSVGAIRTGSAYLFDLADLTSQTKITVSDGASEDYFGCSVALSENYAVIGARSANPAGFDSGAAYVYDIADVSSETKLVPDGLETADNFGTSVSVSGDKVLVGSTGDDDSATAAGAVYLYDLSDSSVTKMTAGDGANNDSLGVDAAISGTNIIVGAFGDDDKGAETGSAYFVYAPQSNITLNNLDGSGETSAIATYGQPMPGGIAAPTKDGYNFAGYYTNLYDAGSQYYNADMTSAQNWDIIGNATLYAKWETVALSIDTDALSEATVGESYSFSMAASGGKAGYTWYAQGLPSGLSIAGDTGIIGGTANESGSFSVNIRVYDSLGQSTDKDLTLTVNAQPQTGKYTITPIADSVCTPGTAGAFTILTINSGVSGFKYVQANITPTVAHEGEETVVFVHLRNGAQIGFSCTAADFDIVNTAGAGFNVLAGDVIKIYVVDAISNDPGVVPVILQ